MPSVIGPSSDGRPVKISTLDYLNITSHFSVLFWGSTAEQLSGEYVSALSSPIEPGWVMMPGKRATPGPVDQRVAVAVSHFGTEVGPKLRKRVGSPEEQLREPFSRLIREVGRILGVKVDTYGEASLPTLGIRPDYVVDVAGARVGYVELKRPGRGVPTTWSPDKRERIQWEQLSLLPNVLYTDGEQWAVYRYGEIVGRVARLSAPLERAGANLAPADGQLARVLTEFLLWKPDSPRTVSQLVRAVARLCRLLRSEVSETLSRERRAQEAQAVFTGLASDWRRLLFPDLPDDGFADAYAQTVTFALLLARLDGIDFDAKDLPEIARLLGKKHSLMGKALAVLTEGSVEGRSIVVPTLLRVIGAVDWEITGGADSDSYLSLYESFLAEYDEELRERSGSYYTPKEVVTFMVGFVEELLRTHLDKEWGLATEDVIILDPAMGTGTFLLSVIDRVAGTIAEEQGPGAVPAELRDLFKRLIGFEKQAGPYAVAELRINQAIKAEHGTEIPESEARLYLADTLDSPYEEDFGSLSGMDAITRSRREANKVKLSTPVMVVIGNPPYDAKAKGQGGWIETGNPNHGQPPLDAFRAAGNGRYEYVLSDFYVFFWRWATWKVFDAHPEHPAGIVAFISPRSYTTGPGYAGMREYLRRTADEGWVIDVSPEDSLQPDVPTRIFPGVQNPLCISVYLRRGAPDESTPARVRYRAVSGQRDEKFRQLGGISAEDDGWEAAADGWQAPFTPPSSKTWTEYPALGDLMPWHAPGIKPNRTWVYAPDTDTLKRRWNQLVSEDPEVRAKLFRESDSRTVDSSVPPLPGFPLATASIRSATGPCPSPVRVAYRSFDRQWIIPDNRLLHRASPGLWQVRQAPGQVFTVEQHAQPLTSGPGLVFAAYPPDMHYFNGRGGRVLPLYRDAEGRAPNIAPGLLGELGRRLAMPSPTPEDFLAYVAGVTAHPGYTARFAQDLKNPGVRVPLTTVPELWVEAVAIGREVLWLHTYGREFADPATERPPGAPRLTGERQPMCTAPIPHAKDDMPDEITYDAATQTLLVGAGKIEPVGEEVWQYQTSGMRVVKKWFDYRRSRPAGRRSSPLDEENAETWSATFTRELLELLRVLTRCVALEPAQADLLGRICQGPLVSTTDLHEARVLPPARSTRRPIPTETQATLF